VLDATNQHIVVGIFAEGLRYSNTTHAPRESFLKLIPEIDLALGVTGLERPDRILCAIGPGSFTGIRICVSAARNLAQLWSIPVRGVNSLCGFGLAIAKSTGESSVISVDGKQKRFYTQFIPAGADAQMIDSGETHDLAADEIVARARQLGARVYCSDVGAFAQESGVVVEPLPEPAAEDLYEFGAATTGGYASWTELHPFYLRKDPAEQKYPQGFNRT